MNILVVEDDAVAAELLKSVLTELGHSATLSTDGREALDLIRNGDGSVVISDWEMPGLNGLELCRAIRAEELGRYIYVILLTHRDSKSHLVEGLTAGADEFMSKPFSPDELSIRLSNAERLLTLETRDLVIFALAKLAESRDPETGEHLERVRAYSRTLAADLAGHEDFPGEITPGFVSLIYKTSPLHDIGKVSIPDHVLLKPGRLDDQEFEIMKTHAQAGAETLGRALKQYPSAEFLRMARDIAGCHHERYDGQGYPKGLAGKDIPLSARIFAVADVYDALVSNRVYKAAFTHHVARETILKGNGTQFDPVVIQAFLRCEDEFKRLAGR